MKLYLFNGGLPPDQLNDLVLRIKARLPDLEVINRIEDLVKKRATESNQESICILFPVAPSAQFSLDRIVNIATHYRDSIFFIFISDDIPASDYKRLVQTGGADWASMAGAPQEITDILARRQRPEAGGAKPSGKPAIVSFLPSAGGVGTATLAIEAGIQLRAHKATRQRRLCLLDLDFQNSHVCDYLDIEPRMHIHDIAASPERLDDQLFELFVTRHASGLDVLACARNKSASADVGLAPLEALFGKMTGRYDLVLLDLPATWFGWTPQILSVSDLVLVCGLNTIPGLREIAETMKAVRALEQTHAETSAILNRCEHGMLGGVSRRQHVKNVLANEEVFYVREDTAAAVHASNIGVPLSSSDQSNKIAKDTAAIVGRIAALEPARQEAAARQ